MSKPDTLPEVLDLNGDKAPRFITYIDGENDEQSISFADLQSRALGILHHFQERRISAGDELIIFTNNNEQFVDAFWACLYGGIVPVPVAVGISDDHRFKLLKIFETLRSAYVYTERSLTRRLSDFGASNGLEGRIGKMLDRSIVVDDIRDISTAGERHRSRPADTAFIQFSSGSTSDPKGVVLTHLNVLTNILAVNEAGGYTDRDRSLSWMPLTHDMGLIGFHLCMMAANITQFIMDTKVFVRRPLLWLEKASEKRATLLCSPNFGYKHFLKLFESKGLGEVDLSAVRILFNGAEPISVELCERFTHELASYGLPRTAMFPVYGLAEATVGVSFPPLGKPFGTVTVQRHSLRIGAPFQTALDTDEDAVRFAVVGKPLRDCQVRICDDEDEVLSEKTVGHIQIKGGNVTSGYYGATQTGARAFTRDGWLRTGDLGFFVDGELVITGRSKDIIFVNGQNYYPHDIEGIAQEIAGLELGKVVVAGQSSSVSGTDDILVFVLHRGALEEFVDLELELRRHVNEKTGLEVRHVIPVAKIPKTTSGKVQRHHLTAAYLQGEHAERIAELERLQRSRTISEAPQGSDLAHIIKNICNTIVVDKAIDLDDNLFEIGISSLALAQIHERIDELYPGQLEIGDVFDHPSVRELAAFLESKTGC